MEQAETHGSVRYQTVSGDYFDKRGLRRHAGVWSLWALGVGAVISGDFFGWNFGLAAGGFGGLFVATIIVTVMYFGLCCSIAEMSPALPHSGGAYSFGRSAMGPWGGFITGLGQTMEYVITPAVIVVGIGGYLGAIFGTPPEAAPAWWLLAYAIFVGLNVWGAEISFRFTVAITFVALAILLVFYIGAVAHFDPAFLRMEPDEPGGSPWFPKGWLGVAWALPFAIWFYLAIEELPLAAEESEEPGRDMPKGIIYALLTLVVTGVLVLFLNAGVAPGAQAVGYSDEPLLLGLEAVFGDGVGARLLALIAVAGLIASFHTIIFAYGRNVFALSRAGYFPNWMSITHPTRRTPHVALVIGAVIGYLAALAIYFSEAIFGEVPVGAVLLNMAVFGAVISYAMQCYAFIKLRNDLPHIDRPYRSPLGVPGAWIALVIAVITLIFLFLTPDYRAGVWGTAIWYVVALLCFAFYSRHRLVKSPEEDFAIEAWAERAKRLGAPGPSGAAPDEQARGRVAAAGADPHLGLATARAPRRASAANRGSELVSETQKTISPVDGRVYVERPFATEEETAAALARARAAQTSWRQVSVDERAAYCRGMVDAFVAEADAIAEEISWQMGRPVAQSAGEVRGFEERARYMIDIAAGALADIAVEPKPGFTRFIRREPLGVVLTIAPWNYPYLTSVNSIVPAIMAGNTVILRHSAQTPLCAERYAACFAAVDLPEGVFQFLHMSHAGADALIRHPGVDFVAFTGSVGAGRAVQRAAAERFIGVGLELGGKDPAYVRHDADLEQAVAGLVDGAFFNAGQSCCGIERIYVHADVHDEFVARFAELTRDYRLGNPLDRETTLGPMVRPSAADFVRGQIDEAVAAGARALIDPAAFPADAPGSAYMAPQVLVDVDHSMRVMTEESFGPVVGIQRVAGDDEAVALMNDSAFGLTASIWTRDEGAALAIGDRAETGTWYMNRCDYLDPALAWTGVKDSGRGCTLSRVGYEALTRPKSFHLRTAV